MRGCILDSYAMIAYLEDEAGAAKVERFLDKAEKGKLSILMSIVNWGEVYYSIYRSKGEEKAESAIIIMEQLAIKITDVDRDIMYSVAKIKANHAIALGDCFAAAEAKRTDYPVVTGDKEFMKLGKMIQVEWL